MPRPLLRSLRVPLPENCRPARWRLTRLDADLIRRGLMLAPVPPPEDEEEEDD